MSFLKGFTALKAGVMLVFRCAWKKKKKKALWLDMHAQGNHVPLTEIDEAMQM